MGRSQRLRLHDVQEIYRLIGECGELWADPLAWRTHASAGLARLTSVSVAMGAETRGFFGDPDSQIEQIWYVGLDQPGRERHQRYMAEAGFVTYDPPFQRYISLWHGSLNTRSHEQLVSPHEWHNCMLFNEYFRPCSIDDRLLSLCDITRNNGASIFNGFVQFRMVGEPPFTVRERRLVHLFHQELAPLIGTRLVTCLDRGFHGLSPRLRQTLDRLLAGDSEKQIALTLSLSRPTVDQYVQMLYRRFGASSRGELMAYFIAQRPSPLAQHGITRREDTPAIGAAPASPLSPIR